MFDGTQGCPIFYGVSMTVLFRSVTKAEIAILFPYPARVAVVPVTSGTGSGASRRGDLVLGVAEGAEYAVVEPGPTARLGKVRVDVFPDDLAGMRHLEQTTVYALADQRVAVGQALRPGNVGAEEIEQRRVGIFPDDRVAARIDLDDPREGSGVVAPVGPVVEDQDVAVGQWARVVLLGERRAAELPDDVAGGALDRHHGRDVAKAGDDVAVRRFGDGVAVRPFGAMVLQRHRV